VLSSPNSRAISPCDSILPKVSAYLRIDEQNDISGRMDGMKKPDAPFLGSTCMVSHPWSSLR
jgi:hypothetical protein